jgi:hypothetical protein
VELVNLVQPEASLLLEFCAESRQVTLRHQGCLGESRSGLELMTHNFVLSSPKWWSTAIPICRLAKRTPLAEVGTSRGHAVLRLQVAGSAVSMW